MVEADPTMRAGRNAFVVLLVALLFTWAYLIAFFGENDPVLFGLWALGAASYYVSYYYYTRRS